MLENEFIVPKLVFNILDQEMALDILIGSSINRSFQEADLSDPDTCNLKPFQI